MIVIRQKEFNSKAQKARRRNWDIQQGLNQPDSTDAKSQAQMLGKEKTEDLLNKYTKSTTTKKEGAIKTSFGTFGGNNVTRTAVKNRKELDTMERARNLISEGRKSSRNKDSRHPGRFWDNVNEHINKKGRDEKFHRAHYGDRPMEDTKYTIEHALKESKNKQYLKKQRINNLKAAGAVAATVGTVAGIGYGIKKAVDKNKKENGKEK